MRQARTVFAAAFDALAQRRSLEASLQAARDKLPRAQAALQDILQTLANGHQASDAFFGLPFRPRLDFIGVNYYRGVQVYAGRAFQLATAATQSAYTGAQFTQNLSETMEAHPLLNDLQWEVYPRGLFELIQRITHDFNRLPVLVTENGIPEIRDRCRAAYIVAHLEQLQRAQREGARLLGYLHWSIADNFEWFENYRPHARFGLFGIDRTSGPPHPRHMTEGALALYRATAERDVGGLALRFGNFHPRGWAVDTPLRSPARCVIGNFEPGPLVPAGQGLSLLFSRATDDTLLILGHEPDRGLWWQARGHVVDSGELSFALPVGAFRDSNSTRLSFTGRLDSAGLTGELSATGGRKQSFKGRTWRVVGNWLSDANPHVLQVFAYEPGPSAATRVKLMHMQHRMQTWTVADIATVDPDRISITFDLLPGRAVNLASLEANLDAASGRLVGHLSSRGQRSDWIARRMPDGLPW